jgi:hypothetical protein
MKDNAECMLVLIGATPEGQKELVGFQTGVRESAQRCQPLSCTIFGVARSVNSVRCYQVTRGGGPPSTCGENSSLIGTI